MGRLLGVPSTTLIATVVTTLATLSVTGLATVVPAIRGTLATLVAIATALRGALAGLLTALESAGTALESTLAGLTGHLSGGTRQRGADLIDTQLDNRTLAAILGLI